MASRSKRLQKGVDGPATAPICAKQSSGVAAWKHDSGQAMCIFISLMTIRCGRLLKMTKAVSRRKIQVNILLGSVSTSVDGLDCAHRINCSLTTKSCQENSWNDMVL